VTQVGEILYCYAARQTRSVGRGHWFFHTGQWAVCASAGSTKAGEWHGTIYFAPFGKELPEHAMAFRSIEEVQRFVGEYFEVPVKRVKPGEFPRPDDL